jgi:hypothetical protein
MTDKQLRNEVQLLRDEIAIMKRNYEDILYNIDTDNFSPRFVREQDNMKTAIEVTAEGIETKVSKEEMESYTESTFSQKADEIKVAVKNEVTTERNEALKIYATQSWTTDQITTEVGKVAGDNSSLASRVTQTEDAIKSEVTAREKKDTELSTSISGLSTEFDTFSTSITQTARDITTKVGKIEGGEFGGYTLFNQSSDKFYFDGEKAIFTGAIILTNDNKKARFSISHEEPENDNPFIGIYNYYMDEPIVIGHNLDCVYIYDQRSEDNLVATRGWVNEKVYENSVAKFG